MADLSNLLAGQSNLVTTQMLSTVATSGSYADLSNKPVVISLKGTSVTYPGNDLAADPAGSQTITITGTGFESTPTVYIGGTIAPSVTFVSATQITVTTLAKAAGTYDIYIVNPGGATAIMVMGISYSGVPTWTTAAGTLGTLESNFTIQLQAAGDAPITYALTAGSVLPTGVTLSSTGLITGTSISVEQTFNFSVTAVDAELQDTPRSFSVTVSLGDAYFKYTTLLLTGNGTNAGNNNIFLDSRGFLSTTAEPTLVDDPNNAVNGWFTRTGSTVTTYDNSPREFLVRANGVTIYQSTTSFPASVSYGGVTYTPGAYASSVYGWAGDNNNRFSIVASTAVFTGRSISRVGNTTQGSFSPYGSNWSNYFNGSPDYLSVPSSTAFNIGSNDACVELWVNSSNTSDAVYGGQNTASASTIRILQISGTYCFTINDDNVRSSGISIAVGSWVHLAVTITGGVGRMFVNGVLRYYVTGLGSVATNTGVYLIGSEEASSLYLKGYISNYRFVNGSIPTAYQTSSSTTGTTIFTVPTTPLTAITNTVLLTCQSNRFLDNSTNAFAVTVGGGSPSVQRFNPFGTATAYSTSVIGGSLFFNPTNSSGLRAGTTLFNSMPSAFTLEAWIYPRSYGTSNSQYQNRPIMAKGVVYMNFGLTSSGALQLYHYEGNTQRTNASTTIVPLNAWSHVVASVSAGTITFYINGQSSGTATWYGILGNNTPDFIGYHSEGSGSFNYFDGYLSDVRYAKSVIYSSNFTPSIAPLSAVATTEFLLSGTNSAIYDNAMMNNLETVGNAQISTSVVKYGTGSLAFDGSGDRLIGAPTLLYDLSGNFTIECWVYFNSVAGQYTGIVSYADLNGWFGWQLQKFGNQIAFEFISSNAAIGNVTSSSTVSAGLWYHVAAVRNGSTITIYINGISQGTSTTSASYSSASSFIRVGDDRTLAYPLNAYVDDLRITKGYARYTENFTPPTAAHKTK
jgi:hypothetical protein